MVKLLRNLFVTTKLVAEFSIIFIVTPADCQEAVREQFGEVQRNLRDIWKKEPRGEKAITAT